MKPEAFEDCLQTFDVFFLHTQINNDVAKIHQTGGII